MVVGFRRRLGGVLLVYATFAASAAAQTPRTEEAHSVEDRDQRARRAFEAGLVALRSERWPEAEGHFRDSLRDVKRASAVYNLAFVLFMQGRATESMAELDELMSGTDEAGARYRRYGAQLMPRVLAQLVTFRLTVRPTEAVVRIDDETTHATGEVRLFRLMPGVHRAEISATGYAAKRVNLFANAGEEVDRAVALDVEAPPSPHGLTAKPPPPEQPARSHPPSTAPSTPSSTLLPWLVAGTGAALLVAGTITGALALSADDQLSSQCPGTRCPTSLKSKGDRVMALGHATDALLVSGGVLVAGGVTWLLFLPSPPSARRGAGLSVSLGGRF